MQRKKFKRLLIEIHFNCTDLRYTAINPNTLLYLNNYKRKEVITYAQNERQQKPSQNQYHQRLRILDRREAGIYRFPDCRDRIHHRQH